MIFDNVSIQDVIVIPETMLYIGTVLDNHVQCPRKYFRCNTTKVIGYTYEDYAS